MLVLFPVLLTGHFCDRLLYAEIKREGLVHFISDINVYLGRQKGRGAPEQKSVHFLSCTVVNNRVVRRPWRFNRVCVMTSGIQIVDQASPTTNMKCAHTL